MLINKKPPIIVGAVVLGVSILIGVLFVIRGGIKKDKIIYLSIVPKEVTVTLGDFEAEVIVETGENRISGVNASMTIGSQIEGVAIEVNNEVFNSVIISEVIDNKVVIGAVSMKVREELEMGKVVLGTLKLRALEKGKVDIVLSGDSMVSVAGADEGVKMELKTKKLEVL